MTNPKSARSPFTAVVTIGVASVRTEDDPDSWGVVSEALCALDGDEAHARAKRSLKVSFDGDMDNPANFDNLRIVPGSIDFRSMDAEAGQFGDLTFEVEGRAADVSSEALEDLFHAFVIELTVDGATVNAGGWEEYGIEARTE